VPVVALRELLGQPEVSEFLRGIVSRGRYANAYLFHGPAGVGKGTAALAFARAALCDRVPGAAAFAPRPGEPSLFGDAPAAPPAPGDDACGECPACGKSAQLAHPDLRFVFPVSGEEREIEATVIETLEAWREDPLHVFQYDRAASVRLAQTRELQRELAYRPYEAARRVVVVRDCDRMREDQYSALLKSLEEPAPTTLWVLTTSRLSRVPATIRSRCQRVRFAPLAEAAIRGVLQDRAEVAEPEARMLAALAGGSLARALVLRGEDAKGQRDLALGLLAQALGGEPRALWAAVSKVASGATRNREAIRRTLEFQMLWLRDVLRARAGLEDGLLVNRDRAKEVRAIAGRLEPAEIRRRLFVLEEALRAIDGNVSADLTLMSALARVGGSRVGEGAWPPHPTARWDV
jgi:DNA polymerase-3 subunit delta'